MCRHAAEKHEYYQLYKIEILHTEQQLDTKREEANCTKKLPKAQHWEVQK